MTVGAAGLPLHATNVSLSEESRAARLTTTGSVSTDGTTNSLLEEGEHLSVLASLGSNRSNSVLAGNLVGVELLRDLGKNALHTSTQFAVGSVRLGHAATEGSEILLLGGRLGLRHELLHFAGTGTEETAELAGFPGQSPGSQLGGSTGLVLGPDRLGNLVVGV